MNLPSCRLLRSVSRHICSSATVALVLLALSFTSCGDQPPSMSHIVKCWDRYSGVPLGSVTCDTIEIQGDSVVPLSTEERLRNHTALAYRFERMLGMDTGSVAFPPFVQDSTFCLMRRNVGSMSFDGDDIPVAFYEIQGCRGNSVAVLGEAVFAAGFGLLINRPKLAAPVVLVRVEKEGRSVDTGELVEAVFADTTFFPPYRPDSTAAGE